MTKRNTIVVTCDLPHCATVISINLVLVLCLIGSVCCVIMPPKQTIYKSHTLDPGKPILHIDDTNSENNEPYLLTILEVDHIDTLVDKLTYMTINLNRLIDRPIHVQVALSDERDMLTFDVSDNAKNPDLGNITSHSLTIIYPKAQSGDRRVAFKTKETAGFTKIVCHVFDQILPSNEVSTPDYKDIKLNPKIDDSSAFITINIAKDETVSKFSDIFGWTYFTAWSLSFYTQLTLNFRRKSVVGLNFDFLALNLLGFTFYLIYNWVLLFSTEAQHEYQRRYHLSRVSADLNDLFFAAHAVLITLVIIVQCFIYEREDQAVSIPAASFVLGSVSIGCILYVLSLFKVLSILDVAFVLSYVKLFITIIKYTPQAIMNYKKKSTTGWSIHNILLDFMGGILSILQMFLLAYNFNDWIQVFGNPTKFGLGLVSICFDILFMIQHYILYTKPEEYSIEPREPIEPVLSQSIRDLNATSPSLSDSNDLNPIIAPEVINRPIVKFHEQGSSQEQNQDTNVTNVQGN